MTEASPSTASLAVVISHWTGHRRALLSKLLAGMRRHAPGTPYSLCIVVNGGDSAPVQAADLSAPAGVQPVVVNRANHGYNIGAWDAGWHAMPGHDAYLFLQSECFIRRAGWADAFAWRLANDPGVGVLGEAVMWDRMGWDYVKRATARDLGGQWAGPGENPIDVYRAALARRGIPEGEEATHVQSLVLAMRGPLLERMGGLPVGETYQEAVAAEVAISRQAEALGYRVARVAGAPFHFIGHRQWTPLNQAAMRWRNRLRPHLAPVKNAVRALTGRG